MGTRREGSGAGLIERVLSGPQGPGVAALFDLDRTLIEGCTATAFLWHRLQTQALSAGELFATVSASLAFGAGRIGFARFLQQTTAAARGVEESVLCALGEEVFRRHLAARVYPEALRLIEAHRRRGHFLAIITSATRYQVEPIAHRLGIPFVACNRLEARAGVLTGRILHPLCYGRGKLDAAKRFEARHGFDLERSAFYSDSHEDLPLLESVGHPCAVNPTPRLAEIAAERGWATHVFRSPAGALRRRLDGLAARWLLPRGGAASPEAA